MNHGIRDRLRAHIPAHNAAPALSSVIAAAAGMDRRTVASLLSSMALEGWLDREGPPKRFAYRLLHPDALAAKMQASVDQRKAAIARHTASNRKKARKSMTLKHYDRSETLDPHAPAVNPGVRPKWCGSVPDRFAVTLTASHFGPIGSYAPAESAIARAWGR